MIYERGPLGASRWLFMILTPEIKHKTLASSRLIVIELFIGSHNGF